MKNTIIILLAAFCLGLNGCSGSGNAANEESAPPSRTAPSPIGVAEGGEDALVALEGAPEAAPAPVSPLSKPAPAVVGEAPADQPAENRPAKTAALPPLETTPAPGAKMAASANTAPEAKPQTREIDIVGRTLDQLKQLGIKLDNSQQQKLKSISTSYDFNTVAAGEERRALRRKYMQEVYKTVLTAEQQQTVKAKRQFQE